MNLYLDVLFSVSVNNKYFKWYNQIVLNALHRANTVGYHEKHHILPKSFGLGGYSDSNNIVVLTAREHFLCHVLLVKFSSGQFKYRMGRALMMMGTKSNVRYLNSKLHDIFRGYVKHSPETKKLMSTAAKNRDPISSNTRNQMSISQNKRHADPVTAFKNDTILKLRAANTGANNPAAKSVNVLGSIYHSHKEAMTTLSLSRRQLQKLINGESLTIEEAKLHSGHKSRIKTHTSNSTKRLQVIISGIKYSSIRSAAKSLNVSYSQIRRMLANNLTVEDIKSISISEHRSRNNIRRAPININGIIYDSKNAAQLALNVTYRELQKLITQ